MIGTLCSVRNREARVCLSGTAARPQAVATFAAQNRITARAIDADFEAQLGQSAIEGTVCC